MKKALPMLFAFGITVLCLFSATTQVMADNQTLIVYYFYGNVRCASCHKIEQYTRNTLTTHFQSQIDKGTVVFSAINMDEPENQHFVQDYNLYNQDHCSISTKQRQRSYI